MARRWRVCAIVGLAVFILPGCFPFWMRSQAKIESENTRFVNAESRETIPAVLIIPVYYVGEGVATMYGEGPHKTLSLRDIVANPFIYTGEQPFKVKRPRNLGIMGGPGMLYIGRGAGVISVMVIAPGYQTKDFSDLWSLPEQIPLAPVSSEESAAELQRLMDAVQAGCIDRSSKGKEPIRVRFTSAEKETVLRFLREGIAEVERACATGADSGAR